MINQKEVVFGHLREEMGGKFAYTEDTNHCDGGAMSNPGSPKRPKGEDY